MANIQIQILPHAWAYPYGKECAYSSYLRIKKEAFEELKKHELKYRDTLGVAVSVRVAQTKKGAFMIATAVLYDYPFSYGRPIMERAFKVLKGLYLGWRAFGVETFSTQFINL